MKEFLMGAAAVWTRNFWDWRRFYVTSVLINFMEPVANLVALGYGLGAYVSYLRGMSFVEFIAPGLLAATVMNAVTFDICWEAFNRLKETKIYDSMLSTPLSVREIVAGEMLWEATRAILFGLSFDVVLVAFGVVHWVSLVVLPPFLAVMGMVFGAMGLCVAALARTYDDLFYYFTLVINPMFMFSGVFFPVSDLPPVIAKVIQALPFYHMVELTRQLLSMTFYPSFLLNAAVIIGLTVILSPWPVFLLRKALQK